ncbi:unnamed protein product [Lactuca saligna]|uniref:tRNA nucleotidyltransferase/poly(A) polymerase RNA and SrmB- binding domain-containing protein n=1 Tax=Lactuca saligna TaxID=75948 RepID=A0AA35VNU7_LACSI|nr:unnamed protein product [Lactuca saligna]
MQAIGNHVGLTIGGSNGHFKLNFFKLMISSTLLHTGIMMEVDYMLLYGATESSISLLQKYHILEILLPFQAACISRQPSGSEQNSVVGLLDMKGMKKDERDELNDCFHKFNSLDVKFDKMDEKQLPRLAHIEGSKLKEATIKVRVLTSEEFDAKFDKSELVQF